MDRIDHAFYALRQRMNDIATPQRVGAAPESLASLIDKVNAAKQMYQSSARR